MITALLGAIYYPAFNWMWGRWNSEDTYYSHGPLIIIACLFFIWSKRSTLSEIKTNPSYIGIVLIVLALVFHLGGTFINLYFISACSMIILIMGVVMLMVGLSALKEVLFPIVYLLFMIPLPMVLVSNIVLKMKLFAAELATSALNKIGLEAVRDGSIINMANSYLEVEAPCSGLRSLIALMAFGAAFAYLTNNSLWKKWLLFLSALPIAIAANVMRIVLLGWVSDVYGMKAAQGWVHDFSGFLLFAVAALGMLAMNGLLTTQKSLLEDKNEG
ncbi:MAG: exosortase [PVC group bacterium]|nr:exosortase [PVC group bacterium]